MIGLRSIVQGDILNMPIADGLMEGLGDCQTLPIATSHSAYIFPKIRQKQMLHGRCTVNVWDRHRCLYWTWCDIVGQEQKGFRVSTSHAWIRVLLNINVHLRKRETGLTSCYSLASIEDTCKVKI